MKYDTPVAKNDALLNVLGSKILRIYCYLRKARYRVEGTEGSHLRGVDIKIYI